MIWDYVVISLEQTGEKKKQSKLQLNLSSLLWFTFINLNSFTCGDVLYAENLITL